MKQRFPNFVYNPITLIGVAIAALSFKLIIFFFFLVLFSSKEKTYMGILTYITYITNIS